VEIRKDGKPILILPPFVLGANILGFLPGENRSYAHCFANQGIPTYIRILKDIQTTEPLQVMTGEDDARDTRKFCESLIQAHGKPVTLNGYCQGGYSGLCNLLSGELDGLVDAFITCVSPMDGTRSVGLSGFLKSLPARFNDLAYGSKTLPNGNQVADGHLMGWVYKLKSIEHETPIPAFYRNLMMFARQQGKGKPVKISKTAAALNYWLNNERNDLPLAITRMSYDSYNIPIDDEGTLPVKLFGRRLNLKRINELEIPWLICYGEHDDLVEKETARAPVDYIDVEVTPFPKGHVAMATSWSDPGSACALHTRFGTGNWRGPVRFQLDLDHALRQKTAESPLPSSGPATEVASAEPLSADQVDEPVAAATIDPAAAEASMSDRTSASKQAPLKAKAAAKTRASTQVESAPKTANAAPEQTDAVTRTPAAKPAKKAKAAPRSKGPAKTRPAPKAKATSKTKATPKAKPAPKAKAAPKPRAK
jgi:hypothetical protein